MKFYFRSESSEKTQLNYFVYNVITGCSKKERKKSVLKKAS